LRSRRSARSGRGAGAARAAVADHTEVRSVREVEIGMDYSISMHMLFDPGHTLDERILREQFGY
jgi:NAD+ kinase